MQEFSIIEQDYIVLLQSKNKDIESLLSTAVAGENIGVVSIESSADIRKQGLKGQVLTCIIGSDVDDPVQSAQRFHVLENDAKIILLSNSEMSTEILKEAIRFSPFLGPDVFCLDESKESDLERLGEILKNSLQAEKYRAIIAETNSRITSSVSSRQQAFSQQFTNKLMDVTPVGIAIVSMDGKVTGWNKKAASIFQKSEAQVLGAPLTELFDPLEGDKLDLYLRKNFERTTSNGPIDLELERASQDASRQILDITAAPFMYSDVDKKLVILAIKDVTEREQAKQDLQVLNDTLEERVEERTEALQSYQDQLRSLGSQLSKAEEKERQRLASELHDNLGQMLALIKIKVSLIQIYPLPGEVIADLEDLKEGVEDALVYTRNLMSDLKPPPTLDNEDIRQTVEWLAKKMEKHDLHVTIEDDNQPKPVVEEIQTILVQCIRELLFNVIRHAGVNKAEIKLFRVNKEAKIVVEDKGIGFDPDLDRSHLLESGFGLFNISERIDLLGGSLDIDSKPGAGTRVTICVPLKKKVKKSRQPADRDRVIPAAQGKPDKIKVLLVDDHKMMREGLRKIIDEQEDLIVVSEAADGEEALEEAKKTSPDIVVMDVNMPVMDGIEATRILSEKMPGIRVIALSFHDHQNVITSMENAGATAYLTKNEAFESLCATIRSEAKLVR